MQEILVKTHLIIKDIHEEYYMNWCGKFSEVKPKLRNGKPLFNIVGGGGRAEEVNTSDIKLLERIAKNLTAPKGRQAVTTDKSRIYIIEEDGKNKLMGILTHDHVKTFVPVSDRVGYRDI